MHLFQIKEHTLIADLLQDRELPSTYWHAMGHGGSESAVPCRC